MTVIEVRYARCVECESPISYQVRLSSTPVRVHLASPPVESALRTPSGSECRAAPADLRTLCWDCFQRLADEIDRVATRLGLRKGWGVK